MKTIDLSKTNQTLAEILEQVGEDTIIIKTIEGKEFILTAVDEFDQEVALVQQNEELMKFLDERSKDTKRYTLNEVREKLKENESK